MASEPIPYAGSHAVLIGVSSYLDSAFPDVPAARNSLQAMRSLLADPALCGWPPEQITVIADPADVTELAHRLADIADSTTGVLLLYYVGHGVLAKPRSELCLTVTSTRDGRERISGLQWDAVREIILKSHARVKLVVLDCCFAGRAIEALSSGGVDTVLAEAADIKGAYTLTATTPTRTAHVPPPDQQVAACTSFTGEFRDLIREGIPGKPEQLTFSDLYPELELRLRARGLPEPNQRGTATAQWFPFTRNAAVLPGPPDRRRRRPSLRGFREALPGRDATVPPTRVPPTPAGRPLVFDGTSHTTRKSLADAIRKRWPLAAERFFGTMGTREAPGEFWVALLDWLRQFNDPAVDDVEGRMDLVDGKLTSGLPPDLKLLHLLLWLDPNGPPVYRGRTVTVRALVDDCRAVAEGTPWRRTDLLHDLGEPEVLGTLTRFTELSGLSGLSRRWNELGREWDGQIAPVAAGWGDDDAEVRHLTLLAALGAPARKTLNDLAKRCVQPAPGDLPPYDQLVTLGRRLGLEPVVRIVHGRAANQEVSRIRRRLDEQARQQQARLEADRSRVATRQAEREAMQRQAAVRAQWAAQEARRTSATARMAALRRSIVWPLIWATPVALPVVTILPTIPKFNSYIEYFALIGLVLAVLLYVLTLTPPEGRNGAYRPPLFALNHWAELRGPQTSQAPQWAILGEFLFVLPSIDISDIPTDPIDFGAKAVFVTLCWVGGCFCFLAMVKYAQNWDGEYQRAKARHQQELAAAAERR